MKGVFEELGIPTKWQGEFNSWGVEFEEDTGSSGDMVYGYYFIVPEHADSDFLTEMGWEVGQSIELSLNAFDAPEDFD